MSSRLIIAGSRVLTIKPARLLEWVHSALDEFGWGDPPDLEIVSGCAAGIDRSGEALSVLMCNAPATKFPADWNAHGKAAGDIRNEQMARYANGALVVLNGRPSPGSSNMYTWMGVLGKPAKLVVV